jgi:DNA-binding NarL/FixJ family response regulator
VSLRHANGRHELNEKMTRQYKIEVVIADGQPEALSALRGWFDGRERFRVSSSATDAAQLLDHLARQSGDLVVMNCDIEGFARNASDASDAAARGGDFAVLRELRRLHPDVPVVVLSSADDARTLRALHDAGAAGIVSMQDDMRDLERVCDRVLSGARQVASRRIAGLLNAARSFDTPAMYRNVRVSVKLKAPL